MCIRDRLLGNSEDGGRHVGLDVDYANNRYFYSASYDGIYSAPLDDSDGPTLINELQGCAGIKYNPADGKVYFSSVDDNTINSMNADGSDWNTLYDYDSNVDGPRQIDIDAASGKIYWANRGSDNCLLYTSPSPRD